MAVLSARTRPNHTGYGEKNAVCDDWLSIVLNGAGVSSVSSPIFNIDKHNLREYITIRLN